MNLDSPRHDWPTLMNRSEEVWSAVLGREGCAVRASWPTPTAPIDAGVSAAGAYLFKVCV